ncbi:MAG: SET domain-containing protein [Bradyrhizobium sp.]
MMLVRTELKPSSIHGLGVFLTESVMAGTVIWRFDSRIDRVYSADEISSLPSITRDFIETYSTWHSAAQVWVLCGDNGRHFNHSNSPNTISDGIAFGQDVALTDLPSGCELTSDYTTICDAVRLNGLAFA